MPATAQLTTVIIDCADPAPLAAFYGAALGWEVVYSDPDYVQVGDGGPVRLAFQRIDGYRPPRWPDPAKHAHLDLRVDDLEAAAKELVAQGASRPEFQPGGNEWVVLTDPQGHPFCLVTG